MVRKKRFELSRKNNNGKRSRVLGVLLVASLCCASFPTHASTPGFCGISVAQSVLTSIAPSPDGGFWFQLHRAFDEVASTGTYQAGQATEFEDVSESGTIVPAFQNGRRINGYYIITFDGRINPRGDAVSQTFCDGRLSNCSGYPSNPGSSEYIVAAAAKWDGQGLWAVDRKGRVWTAGNAQSFGDVQSDSSIPTGIAVTPSGLGYYITLEDGGLYSFGDAVFMGRFPDKVTGIALDVDEWCNVIGYWLTVQDGGVFSFGQAPFYGSSGGGGVCLSTAVGFTAFPMGLSDFGCHPTRGYAFVTAQGLVNQFDASGPVIYPPPSRLQNLDPPAIHSPAQKQN